MGTYRKPRLIAVVGPTASGKSALGLALAKRFQGEILCVDSRTIYQGCDIGTAKLEGEKREDGFVIVEGIPHFGIDIISPDEGYSAAAFKEYAEKIISDILSRHHVPILVGGTGLWMNAILGGLSIPAVPADLSLRATLEEQSIEDLVQEYQKLDPVGAERIDQKNRRRLIRAIEVSRLLGIPFSQAMVMVDVPYEVLWIGMDVPRPILVDRINRRVDEMIISGLEQEVCSLVERYGYDAPALSGIGYREFCDFFQGKIDRQTAIEQIKKDTRHYAKRQLTWFRRRTDIHWIKTEEEGMRLVIDFLLRSS